MEAEIRGLIVLGLTVLAVYLLIAAAVEFSEQQKKAEFTVMRSDIQAWQVSQLMEEARQILRDAAPNELPED